MCEHKIGSAKPNVESVNVDKINCIKVTDTRLWWVAALPCNVLNWSVNIVSLIYLALIPGNLSSYYILRPFHSSSHRIAHSIFGLLHAQQCSLTLLHSLFSRLLALCQSFILPLHLYTIYVDVVWCVRVFEVFAQHITKDWRMMAKGISSRRAHNKIR